MLFVFSVAQYTGYVYMVVLAQLIVVVVSFNIKMGEVEEYHMLKWSFNSPGTTLLWRIKFRERRGGHCAVRCSECPSTSI